MAWSLLIQRRRGHKKAVVAVARKFAILATDIETVCARL
jgi:hypothetical protein